MRDILKVIQNEDHMFADVMIDRQIAEMYPSGCDVFVVMETLPYLQALRQVNGGQLPGKITINVEFV